ncbi:MAG: acylphosphatase [Pseudomonadota bacterium]|nr:acylphosphatase [Pseudomonadota bacterium]
MGKGVVNKAVRVVIRGRVQGVGYRMWVERTAASLALRGTVRNRSDACVEIVLAGPAERIQTMVELCRAGPRSAKVDAVETSELDWEGEGFTILPTS